MKRILIASVSLLIALIYALPNVALIVGVFLAVYGKWLSLIACFIFAYNIAKLVESKYTEYLEKRNANSTEETSDDGQRACGEHEENEKYEYEIHADGIDFTFKNIRDHDGRQLSRLKFMREKFFKDQ